jgi:hypothetical protein
LRVGVGVVRLFQGPCGPRAHEVPIQAHDPIEHEGYNRTDQQASDQAHSDYVGTARALGQLHVNSSVIMAHPKRTSGASACPFEFLVCIVMFLLLSCRACV